MNIPNEVGANAYFGRYLGSSDFDIYAGLDVERFSTFNTDQIVDGEPINVYNHRVSYFTTGVSKFTSLFGLSTLFKASVSYIVNSSNDAKNGKNPFRGYKSILFGNVKISDSWSLSTFIKQHNLESDTTLQITRYGFGFSYGF